MKQGWINDGYEKLHYVNGVIHCDDGPAAINVDGLYEGWRFNGKHHRKDGPARIWRATHKLKERMEWWYDGTLIGSSDFGYTQEKFEKWSKFRVFL